MKLKMNVKGIIVTALAVYGAVRLLNDIRMANEESPTRSITDTVKPVNRLAVEVDDILPEGNMPGKLRDYIKVDFKGRALANDFMDFLKNRKKYYNHLLKASTNDNTSKAKPKEKWVTVRDGGQIAIYFLTLEEAHEYAAKLKEKTWLSNSRYHPANTRDIYSINSEVFVSMARNASIVMPSSIPFENGWLYHIYDEVNFEPIPMRDSDLYCIKIDVGYCTTY